MRIDSAGQEGRVGWAESQVMGALLRSLQPSIKYCSRVRPPDYLKAKGKKGGKQNIGVVGLGRCTVPGQLVGENTFQASQPPQLLRTLASASSR